MPRPPFTVALPVPEIDWSYAVIERLNPQTLTASLVPFDPGKLVLGHDPSQNLPFESGDVVTLSSRRISGFPRPNEPSSFASRANLRRQASTACNRAKHCRQLVVRAGGLTSKAYLFGSEFTRESTRVFQQLRLNDYLSNLELEIDRATIAAAAASPPMTLRQLPPPEAW